MFGWNTTTTRHSVDKNHSTILLAVLFVNESLERWKERDPWFFIFRFNCFSLRWKIVIHPVVKQRGKETAKTLRVEKVMCVCLWYVTAAKVMNYCDLVLPIITWKSGVWNPILLYLDDSAQFHTWIASIRSQWKWQKFFKRKSKKEGKKNDFISVEKPLKALSVVTHYCLIQSSRR